MFIFRKSLPLRPMIVTPEHWPGIPCKYWLQPLTDDASSLAANIKDRGGLWRRDIRNVVDIEPRRTLICEPTDSMFQKMCLGVFLNLSKRIDVMCVGVPLWKGAFDAIL